MCTEQAGKLLERGSESECCEAIISVCDDAHVRVALYLLVCMTRTQLYTVSNIHYVSLNDLANGTLSYS